MSDSITVIRPYAKAVFLMAKGSGLYEEWSGMLVFLSNLVRNDQMITILQDPTIGNQKKADFIISIGRQVLSTEGENLVKVLSKYRRLVHLPELCELYELYREEEEKTMNITVVSAVEVEQSMRNNLITVLSSRFNRKAFVKFEIDSKLLGGMVIRAKDKVINGSVQGRLAALQNFLVARS